MQKVTRTGFTRVWRGEDPRSPRLTGIRGSRRMVKSNRVTNYGNRERPKWGKHEVRL